jgi:bacillithiol system protein YtxJ
MGLFSSFKSNDKVAFPWIELTSSEQLKQAIESSVENAVILFKHSTRCSISSVAKSRFESNWNTELSKVSIYYLDLIAHRNISNEIAELTGIEHQSPQAIVLKNKEVIYDASHSEISAKAIENLLSA